MLAFIVKKGARMIYLDNSATTTNKPAEMREAMLRSLELGNPGRGLSESALDAARSVFETRKKMAEFFGGKINRTVFTYNATHSLNIALLGLISPGDRVLSSYYEHNSVLRPLYSLEASGVDLKLFKPEGLSISLEDIKNNLEDDTRAVVLTHSSNVLGGLTQVREIGQYLREKGVLFILDASQTAGVFPINIEEDFIDALCFTGHKALMGPQGTGGLILSERAEPRAVFSGGTGMFSFEKGMPSHLPDRLEAGTLNGVGIAGLGGSLDYLKKVDIDLLRKKEQDLALDFYDGAKDIDGIKIYSERPEKGAAIVTLNIGDMDSGHVSDLLSRRYSIATRPGAHCAPLVHELLGTVEQGAVRFSFSSYNNKEEVAAALEALKEISAYRNED